MSDLIEAVMRGDLEEVKRLVTNGANVNAANKYGTTPLHVAADSGQAAIVEFLVANGANVNAANKCGNIPLHWAAGHGRAAIVEYLVNQGADVSAVNKVGSTALHVAAMNGHAAIVEFLKRADSVQPGSDNRRDAILSLLAEDEGLRQRLGIKAGLEFAPDFDVERLLKFAIKKHSTTDPSLEADIETGIAFHLQASKMLDSEAECGNSMRP
jgi:ankyrin repeat protein